MLMSQCFEFRLHSRKVFLRAGELLLNLLELLLSGLSRGQKLLAALVEFQSLLFVREAALVDIYQLPERIGGAVVAKGCVEVLAKRIDPTLFGLSGILRLNRHLL